MHEHCTFRASHHIIYNSIHGRSHPKSMRICMQACHQEIQYIDIPVKFKDGDGKLVVQLESWPIMDVHSILSFAWDEAGIQIPQEHIASYWRCSKEHGEPFAQDSSNHHRIPIGLYGDGAKVKYTFGSENVIALFVNLVLWRPRSIRWSRFLITCIPEERCTNETLPEILRRVVWSANHAWEGCWPTRGPRGECLEGSAATMAGKPLTRDFKQFQVVEIRGDWAWHKKVFKFHNCHWNSVGTMCPFCDARGQSDCPDDLFWMLDSQNHGEFTLAEFLANRMPSRGVCTLA